MKRLAALALTFLLSLPIVISHAPVSVVFAQSSNTCHITGILYDQQHNPARGAKLRILSLVKNGQMIQEGVGAQTADNNGRFDFYLERGATAQIRADVSGFNVVGAGPITVNVPDQAAVDLNSWIVVLAGIPSMGLIMANNDLPLTPKVDILNTRNGIKSSLVNGWGTIELNSAHAPTFNGMTLTAPLILPADPISNLQAATKQYVDSVAASGISSGTFETTLQTGYLLTGPTMDGLYRLSTGQLSFPNSNLGIKTNNPQSTFDVFGSVAIGSYAGVTAAPSNGLIVSGNVGIGTSSPSAALDVFGNINGRQKTNGDDFLYGFRKTDSSPTGNFLRFQDNAQTTDLWTVGIDGTLNAGIVPAARLTGLETITIAESQVANLVSDLNSKVPLTRTVNSQPLSANVTLGKSDVGLSNVLNSLQLVVSNNLSDLANATTARANLGLGNVNNTSDANKPVSTATQSALDLKIDKNSSITGATKTKITYDSKGLVTSGADVTTADVADSTDKRYITEAQRTVLNNTSGVNTGDQTFNSLSPMTTLGDIIYGGSAGGGTRLAGNTAATRKFLRQTGNGTLSAAPAWDVLQVGDIPDISATYQPLLGYTPVPNSRLVNGHALSTDITVTKGDVGLGNVENTALSTWAGSTNITTLGTIAAGTWQGSVIGPEYLGSGTRNGSNYLRDDGTWQPVVSGVSSFNGRTGAIIPAANDYTFAQLASKPTTLSGYGITDALATSALDTDATLAANSSTRAPAQSAVKSYVDNALTGLKWKPSVVVATTGNITLSGTQTIDGVSVIADDRVLVKNQSTQTENGVYIVASGAWSRAVDADSAAELLQATLFVQDGTTNADTQWTSTNNSITLGSTNIVFAQVSGAGTYSAGTGLSLSGNQFAVSDAELLAFAGLTSAADRLPYFTGSGAAALATFTSFGRSLVDDADALAARTTLGLVIGADVQGYSANTTLLGNTTTGSGSTIVRATGPTISAPSIDKLANLTTNGFLKISGGDGTLSVDTNTYLTGNQPITLSGDVTGSGSTAVTTAIGAGKVTNSMLAGNIDPTKLLVNSDFGFTSAQSVLRANIGATSTDGFTLTNTTAAANNAQQWSPRLHLTSQGWSTTNSASRPTDWIVENQSVQGTTNPSSNLVFSSQINAGAFSSRLTLSSLGTLQLNGSKPVITLVDSSASRTYQLRNGVSTSSFDIFDQTANATRFHISSDGEVRIGTSTNILGNSSRMFVFGGTAGANIDVMGDGAVSDQATLELEGSDYATNFDSLRFQYYGPNGLGTTMGFNNQRLGVLVFQETLTALIGTSNSTPLILLTSNLERMRIDDSKVQFSGNVLLNITQPTSAGTRDSNLLDQRGTSFDTSGHSADWRRRVNVTSNAGASTMIWESRIDSASFATRMSLSDAGLLGGIGVVNPATGFRIGGAAPSGNVLRGNGAEFVSAQLGFSDLSGSVAGSQMPALTGDVTTSGGSVATTIVNDAVTFAKFQNINTNKLLGRSTSGSGDVEEISLGSGLSLSGGTLSASGGAGSGTVNSGTTGQFAYYASSTAAVSGLNEVFRNASGIVSLNAAVAAKRTATATNYTILTTDKIVAITSTAAARTITLPDGTTAAAGVSSGTVPEYTIIDESNGATSHNITVACAGSDTFVGGATSMVLDINGGSVTVYWTGSAWKVR